MTARCITVSPRKLLLGTVSAMALSIGSAHAVTITVGDATEASPFFFGDKKVSFDPSDCTDCASAELTALDGTDIGFRISFGDPTSQSAGASSSDGPDEDSLGPQSLGFTVMTTNPLFQIIGVSMRADAGVTASFDWQANGESFFFAGVGSASASGDIDLSLSNGGEIANLDTTFDAGVAGSNITGDDSDSTDSTGTGGPVGGALSPAMSQTLTLDWFLGAAADCGITGLGLATCSAEGDAFITSIEVRFVQELVPERPPTKTPEPATLGLFGAGLIGLAWFRRRLRRARLS